MGLTELLVSEYEYLKSKGRSDFTGKGFEIGVFLWAFGVLGFLILGFEGVLGFGVLEIEENGGS